MAGLYGGIEAGGTKFVCATGTGPDDIRAETTFPTTSPSETLAQAIGFFREHAPGNTLVALGIASFGPVDLDRGSAAFGHITTTPKAGWSDFDLLGMTRDALGVPVFLETDVNAAALGESVWGAGQGRDPLIYITVGTGIGGGLLSGGRPVHGLLHPEMGHMRVPHDLAADPFPGVCPYHGDCLEGLAAGPALAQRWGQRAEFLPPDHEAWLLEAKYLGFASSNLVCTVSPQRIILGGGVMEQPGLIERVRYETERVLNGYIRSTRLSHSLEDYIVGPNLGKRAGVLGAIALARNELTRSS